MRKEGELITKKDIGLAIKSIRKRAGKTQKWVARKVRPKPVRPETISRIESGMSNYRIDTLFQIAEALDVDVSEFYRRNPDDMSPRIFIIDENNLEAIIERIIKKLMGG